jgi:hypothetical protein
MEHHKMPEVKIDLTKEHYAGIGRVAVEWSEFEFLVDISTLMLAKIKMKAGFCLTAQIAGAARKLDAYIALAQVLGAEKKTVKALNAFAKDTIGLTEQRNRIIHDTWSALGGPHRFELTARKVLRREYVPVSEDDLVKLTNLIKSHGDRFYELTKNVKAEVEA